MLRFSACADRVFVEANQVVAGIEALVLEEEACKVPRMRFSKSCGRSIPSRIKFVGLNLKRLATLSGA